MRSIVVVFLLSVLPIFSVPAQGQPTGKAKVKSLREWSTAEGDTSKLVLQYEAQYDRKGRIVMFVEPCWRGRAELDTTLVNFSRGGRRKTSVHRCTDSSNGTWTTTYRGNRAITEGPDGRRSMSYDQITGREERHVYEAGDYKHVRETRYNDWRQEVYSLSMEIKQGDTNRIEVITAYRSDGKMLRMEYHHNRFSYVDSFFYDNAGRRCKAVRYQESNGGTDRIVQDSMVTVFRNGTREEIHYTEYRGYYPSSEDGSIRMYAVLKYNSSDSLVEKCQYFREGREWKELYIRDEDGGMMRYEQYSFSEYTVLKDTVPETVFWFNSAGQRICRHTTYGGREEWDYDSTGRLVEHRWKYNGDSFSREQYSCDEQQNETETRYWVAGRLVGICRTEWTYYR